MAHLLQFYAFLTLIHCCYSIIQAAPTWQTSNYIQAASNSVINGTSTTGETTTPVPSATLTFPTAFTSEPNLAYGISYYESSDNLGEQMYEVNRTALTTTSFSVKVQIRGNTDIWIVVVRYIAVSKSFPHHLNSFDNVPVNYNNGALTAFDTRTMTLITYTNTINYTLQANSIGSAYTNFTAPYTNAKILLFMTSMFFDGKQPSSGFAPVDIIADAYAISVDQYVIKVILGVNAICSRLHYSMIIFDQADVQKSADYYMYCQRIDMGTTGGDVELPLQFVSNAIMGWTDFSSDRTQSLVKFALTFQTLSNGSYGIHMPASVPRDSSKRPITRFGFTLFYLKTWICPNLTYYSLTLNLCTQCLITNCSKCLDQTHCHTCQIGYALNAASTCDEIPCTLSHCIACLNTTHCHICNSSQSYDQTNGACILCDNNLDYFINTTTLDCQQCTLTQCTNCSSLTTCQQCNQTNGYFLNITNNFCQTCSLFGCTQCTNLTACTTCDPVLFLNSSELCQACSLENCILCSNLTACLECDIGYWLNSSSVCQRCGVGCLNCTADTGDCLQCDILLGYVIRNGSCQQCDSSLNQFLNISTETCQTCTLNECQVCSSLTECSLCNTNNSYYLLPNNTCQYCNKLDQKFINNLLECQQCSLIQCLNCSSLSTCLQCNVTNNYFINETNKCQLCTLSNCLQCQSLIACLVCDEVNQYFLNISSSLCQPCGLEGCLNCSSSSVCYQCDNTNGYYIDYTSPNNSTCSQQCNTTCMCGGYGLPWIVALAQCTPICGDGIILLSELCDDNNNGTGDGCSALCQVQDSYVCVGQPSNCTQSIVPPTIVIQPESFTIQKQGCNGFLIKISKQKAPNQDITIKNPGIIIKTITNNSTNFDIHAQYTRDILNQPIILILNGLQASINYQPVIPSLYYTENQCKTQENVKKLLLGVQAMSYTVLFVSVFSCKIVGLELFGVLQLAYFTLSDHSFFHSYLAPLTSFKTLNGINLKMVPQSSQVSKAQKQMGVASTFLNNCNIMFIISLSELLIAGILYLISKIINARKLYVFSLNLLKQGFITMILFNSFNFSFSAGVHIKYADKSDQFYTFSTVLMGLTLLTMVIATIVMQFTSSSTYGQFKNKYKETWICRLFIPITLVYRIILGFYTALKSQQQQSTLLILSVVIVFMLYLLTNLPYNDTYQNYRTVIIHATMVVILFTTNYYRSMKSTTPLHIKARINTTAILELVMIVACVGISVLAVIYQLYLVIKECTRDSPSKQSVTNQNQKTEESDIDMDINTNARKQSTEEWIVN